MPAQDVHRYHQHGGEQFEEDKVVEQEVEQIEEVE